MNFCIFEGKNSGFSKYDWSYMENTCQFEIITFIPCHYFKHCAQLVKEAEAPACSELPQDIVLHDIEITFFLKPCLYNLLQFWRRTLNVPYM